MSGDVQSLLCELKVGRAALYDRRLRGLFLYGSYARGDYDAESDFDALVALDSFDSYGAETDRGAELIAGLSLQFGVSISEVIVRERDWLAADSTFLRSVRDQAVAA
jgi:predicted nucleotidyltransferase